MNTLPLSGADIEDPGDQPVVLSLVQLLGCAGLLLPVLCFVVSLSWSVLNCMSESWAEFLFCCFRAADGRNCTVG